mmetsp:Transcript_43035/g.104091  ORF Transcript_43035/g.104091 Transcript_43035/m.104091 type:complete len:353 (-) Transcript_43035:2326-3384(-)
MKAVSNYLGRIQERHFKSLQRKTQKLDAVSSSQLSVYLAEQLGNVDTDNNDQSDGGGRDGDGRDGDHDNDNNSSPSSDASSYVDPDYELIQHDLDKAYDKLEQLETKRGFIKTRLDHYKQKIKSVEEHYYHRNNHKTAPQKTSSAVDQDESVDPNTTSQTPKAMSSDASGEEPTTAAAPAPAEAGTTSTESTSVSKKIQQYKDALKPVEATYKQIESDLNLLQHQINSMHERQQELKLKTEECQVVLQELCLTTGPGGDETGGGAAAATATAVTETVPNSNLDTSSGGDRREESGEEEEGKGAPDEYDEEIGIAHSLPTEVEMAETKSSNADAKSETIAPTSKKGGDDGHVV